MTDSAKAARGGSYSCANSRSPSQGKSLQMRTAFSPIFNLVAICLAALLTSCGLPKNEEEYPSIIPSISGCYELKIRSYEFFDGFSAWWSRSFLCIDSTGKWIESNGLRVRYGSVALEPNKHQQYRGIFKIDTVSTIYIYDNVSGVGQYQFAGFSFYKNDTSSIFVSIENNSVLINGSEATATMAWGYILSDSARAFLSRLSIPAPAYLPQEPDSMVNSIHHMEKYYP